AMPVHLVGGHYQTVLGLGPEKGGFANDPVLGLVEHIGIGGTLLSVIKVYVGLLAATILFIATNAGVIGASRITYAMAGYRQLPSMFRRLHPKFKTPWLSLIVFAGFVSILVLLPGKTNFLSTMYSFGAMLSFTVAHAAVIQLRRKKSGEELAFRSRPNLRWRGVDWPLFAIVGGLGTFLSWVDVVVQYPSTRYAGLGWLAFGFAVYLVYRRRVLRVPLAQTVRAPVEIGPAAALEYRTILVPIAFGYASDEAMDLACRLAAERRASIVAFTAIEVPLELPLDAYLPEQVEEANRQLDEARAIGDAYGVRVIERLARTRNVGRAVVDEATRRGSEIIVMGGPRRIRLHAGRRRIFGDTVDFVLRNAPCRVMVAAQSAAVA
ncbi:MAG TPA: universal stress protein, partial [Gaiellaceae bacterium]|nr:universal stress protein [Gaiellaceae bacterium]